MKEQIEKQAIEEMAEDLMICHVEFGEDDDIRTDYDATATMFYRDKGYRKQIKAEWKSGRKNGQFGYYCTNCDCCFTGENAEWIAKEHDYCPNCGAHMKGGAE
jgi:hypothetical protein